MKKILMIALAFVAFAAYGSATTLQENASDDEDLMDIKQMPKTAVRQPNAHFQYAVYINAESEETASVWLANERTGTVKKICVTNPTAEAQWQRMNGKESDAVDVPLTQIATADKAMIAPGDVSKVIVEGCPDGRNVWTYIIDTNTNTAKQFPSTEGVLDTNWDKKEITLGFYGYDDEGRYSYKKVFSINGKFLRTTGEKERE